MNSDVDSKQKKQLNHRGVAMDGEWKCKYTALKAFHIHPKRNQMVLCAQNRVMQKKT